VGRKGIWKMETTEKVVDSIFSFEKGELEFKFSFSEGLTIPTNEFLKEKFEFAPELDEFFSEYSQISNNWGTEALEGSVSLLQDIKEFVETYGYAWVSEEELDLSFLEDVDLFHTWRKIQDENGNEYSTTLEEAKTFSEWCSKYYSSSDIGSFFDSSEAPQAWNTYNQDNNLSHDLLGILFTWRDHVYMIASVHEGGDPRNSAYTPARAFKDQEELAMYDMCRGTIYCPACESSWYGEGHIFERDEDSFDCYKLNDNEEGQAICPHCGEGVLEGSL
jgi:hypothetical protein